MKRSGIPQLYLAIGLLLFVLQAGKAQLNDQSVKGKYVGKSLFEDLYSNILIKKDHTYSLRQFTAQGRVIQKIKGHWRLEGDDLVLVPENQGPEIKLMARQGQWYAVGPQGFSFEAVYTQYQRRGLVYRKTEGPDTRATAQADQSGR